MNTHSDGRAGERDGPGSDTVRARILDLLARRRVPTDAARPDAVTRQHQSGKWTARERVDALFDPGTFFELDEFTTSRSTDGVDRPGDGVVTGWGLVHGRRVCASSQDFTVSGGALGERHGARIAKVMEMAERIGCPLVFINDSAGASITEGIEALAAYGEIARRHIRLSGVVPQVSMVLGPCAGGAAYAPALTDFVVVVDGMSHMFVTGPDVVASAMGSETVDKDALGGARACTEVNGNAHFLAVDESDAFDWVRTLLAHLPANNTDASPSFATSFATGVTDTDRSLDDTIPDGRLEGYDMRRLLRALLDDAELLELQPRFGGALITGFGVIGGEVIGVVASDPTCGGGAIDGDASDKAARFVRFCDAFGLAVLTLVDVPGFLPGVEQEQRGIVRRGAKVLCAYAEATVPLVTVIVRRAYGGGYVALGSRHLGADLVLAWPSAEIAVMGAEASVAVLHRRELFDAERDGTAASLREKLIRHYRDEVTSPYRAAESGHVDAVIRPCETRQLVAEALHSLRNKNLRGPDRKHNTMPL